MYYTEADENNAPRRSRNTRIALSQSQEVPNNMIRGQSEEALQA